MGGLFKKFKLTVVSEEEEVNEAVKAYDIHKKSLTTMYCNTSPVEEGIMALQKVVKSCLAEHARKALPSTVSGSSAARTFASIFCFASNLNCAPSYLATILYQR